MSKIKPTPRCGLGTEDLTYRQAANSIWNRLNLCLALSCNLGVIPCKEQLIENLAAAQELADLIVHHPDSGE